MSSREIESLENQQEKENMFLSKWKKKHDTHQFVGGYSLPPINMEPDVRGVLVWTIVFRRDPRMSGSM